MKSFKSIVLFILFTNLSTGIAQTLSKPIGFLNLPLTIEDIFKNENNSAKPVFLEAFLPTCQHCIAYNKNLDSPEINKYLDDNFQAYRIDVSKKEVNDFLRSKKIVINSTPTFLVFNHYGVLMNIEEAQPEFNSIEGIKELLNKAKSPTQNQFARFENYKKGIFDNNSLQDIAFYSKMSCDTLNNIEIVNKLTNNLKESEYDSEIAYNIVSKMMMDEQNPLFNYFVNHTSKYESYADANQIKRAIENVIMIALYQKNAKNFSFERYNKMKRELISIGIPLKSVHSRFIYYEVLKDLETKNISNATKRIKTYYEGKPIPSREKEFWCGELKKFNTAHKVCPL
ncbi:hypothetical protein EOJ36_04350 [Sandaracinomonas limnophila]|uniref:Thioredoxin domain-containing protein n=1 Tax=Sandaracinomonas limnophila TaxID=1862386 RepID=A0A437PTS2_9BACT|nr:hypothetical protein [Sandaracinomonas limnophila]RVU25654.1 hypothetical protein EOJ36_04350 [Sandaracinomonas limnophila]